MKLKHLIPFLCFTPVAMMAFSVNPMVAEFDPGSARSQRVFTLKNETDKPTPVEITVAKPTLDENGIESLIQGEGEDLFLIVPPQLTIAPNSQRSVKVIYVGDPLEKEDTYRILFNELPVNLEDTGESDGEVKFNLQVVMQFQTRIWLTPSNLKEELSIVGFEREDLPAPASRSADGSVSDDHSIPMLRLTVANDGSRHGYVNNPILSFTLKNGKKFNLKERRKLEGLAGQLVLKDDRKDLRINWLDEFPAIDEIDDIKLNFRKR